MMMKRTKIEWETYDAHGSRAARQYLLGYVSERRSLEIAISRGAQGEVVITHMRDRATVAIMRRYVS